jgi:hypothetical protein
MLDSVESKIKQVEKRLIREAINLASTFSTKDRNAVIKTAIELRVLKNLING